MLKKTISKVRSTVLELISEKPEVLTKEVRNIVLELISEKPEVLTNIIMELITSKDILTIVGLQLDKAKAARISADIGRRVDELRDKEVEMEQSPEPWFELVTKGYDVERGDELEFAWNSAWIKLLKERGIPGATPADMVQNWVALLNMDMIMTEQGW